MGESDGKTPSAEQQLLEDLAKHPITNVVPTNSSSTTTAPAALPATPAPTTTSNGESAMNMTMIGAVAAGIVLFSLCFAGLVFCVFRKVRKDKKKKREERLKSGGPSTPSSNSDDGGKGNRDRTRRAKANTFDHDLEKFGRPLSKMTTCDTLSTGLVSPFRSLTPSSHSSPRRGRPSSLLYSCTTLPERVDEEGGRQRDDDQRSIINQAHLKSPIVEKVLTESFDVNQGEDRETFDWDRCAFEDLEEEAMWLPSRPESLSSNRSTKHPNRPTGSDRSLLLTPSKSKSMPDCNRSSYQLSISAHHSNRGSAVLDGHEMLVRSPDTTGEENVGGSPQAYRSASSPAVQARVGDGWDTHRGSIEDLQDGVLRPMEGKNSSTSVYSACSNVASFSDPFTGSNSALTLDCHRSTESLRKAGAEAIRSSLVGRPGGGAIGDPSRLLKERGRPRRPSTTGALPLYSNGKQRGTRDNGMLVGTKEATEMRPRSALSESIGAFGSPPASLRMYSGSPPQACVRHARRDAIVALSSPLLHPPPSPSPVAWPKTPPSCSARQEDRPLLEESSPPRTLVSSR